jgi:biotin carboxyl carrier protein
VQYEVEVNGRVRQVHVHRHGGQFAIGIEEREWMVDAARVDSHLLSLLIQPTGVAAPGSPSAAGEAVAVRASHELSIAADAAAAQFTVVARGTPLSVGLNARRRWGRSSDTAASTGGPQRVTAPMPGKVVRVLVKAGESVTARQALVVVEAMKMENELRAAIDGRVADVLVKEGQSVDAGAPLLVVRPN